MERFAYRYDMFLNMQLTMPKSTIKKTYCNENDPFYQPRYFKVVRRHILYNKTTIVP